MKIIKLFMWPIKFPVTFVVTLIQDFYFTLNRPHIDSDEKQITCGAQYKKE